MSGTILFEIQTLDDEGSVVRVEPTEWLKSLPPGAQITQVKTYLRDLRGMHELTQDPVEQAHLTQIIDAIRDYLDKLGD